MASNKLKVGDIYYHDGYPCYYLAIKYPGLRGVNSMDCIALNRNFHGYTDLSDDNIIIVGEITELERIIYGIEDT